MFNEVDVFSDQVLEDVVQRWMRERDFERAWWRNECQESWVRRGVLSDCARYGAAVRRGAPGYELGRLRGRCREQQFVRDLCMGRVVRNAQNQIVRLPRSQWPRGPAPVAGADVRRGVRVVPGRPRSPVADAVLSTLGPRGARMRRGTTPALEHKSMWVPRYIQGGQLAQGALQQRLQREMAQVVRQRQWANRGRGVRAGMPRSHEIVYRLEGLGGVPGAMATTIRQWIQQAAAQAGVRAHILNADDFA